MTREYYKMPNDKFRTTDLKVILNEYKKPTITRIEEALVEKYKTKKNRISFLTRFKTFIFSVVNKIELLVDNIKRQYRDYKIKKIKDKEKLTYQDSFKNTFNMDSKDVISLINRIKPDVIDERLENLRQENIKEVNKLNKVPLFVDVDIIDEHNKSDKNNLPELKEVIKEINKNPFVK